MLGIKPKGLVHASKDSTEPRSGSVVFISRTNPGDGSPGKGVHCVSLATEVGSQEST